MLATAAPSAPPTPAVPLLRNRIFQALWIGRFIASLGKEFEPGVRVAGRAAFDVADELLQVRQPVVTSVGDDLVPVGIEGVVADQSGEPVCA